MWIVACGFQFRSGNPSKSEERTAAPAIGRLLPLNQPIDRGSWASSLFPPSGFIE